MYFVYKNNYIPIFSLSGLDEKTIYLFNVKDLGIMEKSIEDFEIEINDFRNNNELIEKFMSTNVKGLSLKGEERKNHLLELVNLCINEYVRFDDEKMKGEKFNK